MIQMSVKGYQTGQFFLSCRTRRKKNNGNFHKPNYFRCSFWAHIHNQQIKKSLLKPLLLTERLERLYVLFKQLILTLFQAFQTYLLWKMVCNAHLFSWHLIYYGNPEETESGSGDKTVKGINSVKKKKKKSFGGLSLEQK